MTRKNTLDTLIQSILVNIRPILTGCSTVDVVSPVLDFRSALHPLLVGLVLEVTEFPREEPGEHDGHEEPDRNNTNDEDQGNVKHDL